MFDYCYKVFTQQLSFDAQLFDNLDEAHYLCRYISNPLARTAVELGFSRTNKRENYFNIFTYLSDLKYDEFTSLMTEVLQLNQATSIIAECEEDSEFVPLSPIIDSVGAPTTPFTDPPTNAIDQPSSSGLMVTSIPLSEPPPVQSRPKVLGPLDLLQFVQTKNKEQYSYEQLSTLIDALLGTRAKSGDSVHTRLADWYYGLTSPEVDSTSDVQIDTPLLVPHLPLQHYLTSRVRFKILLYAPPNSGKSYLRQKVGPDVYDTDDTKDWKHFPHDSCVLTNIHDLIKWAQFSYAIVPTKKVFDQRCAGRGLVPTRKWYDDMYNNCQSATVVVHSDRYVSEVITRVVKRDFRHFSAKIKAYMENRLESV